MKTFIPDKYHYMPSKKIFLARAGARYKSVINDEKLMDFVNKVYLIGLSNAAPIVYWDVFDKDSIPDGAIPEKFSNYKKFIICASTLGDKFDLVIDKLSEESTMIGMLLDAWGSEALETLNDYFQFHYLQGLSIKTSMRFSPGYGDLNITVNNIYVELLNIAEKVKVNRFGVMLPRKTTTFIAGIND
ncbi:MAG: methionine synthase [Fervidobacterium sp.]|nr:methionine synthase [Fervidobacterium sp.]